MLIVYLFFYDLCLFSVDSSFIDKKHLWTFVSMEIYIKYVIFHKKVYKYG